MRACFAFIRTLLADPRSIRALDEAELDWRHETAGATSPFARDAVTLRTCLACLRVCVMSSMPELRYRYRNREALQVSLFTYRAQSGSLSMVVVFGAATLVVAFTGITEPEHRNTSLLMFALGLGATWREYLNWRRTRHERLVP
jgi:hypothetical protein